MNSQVDIRSLLPAIRVPTLVLHRRGDHDSRTQEGRYTAERIPGARFVELPGEEHLPWVDADQILDLAEEFLTGVLRAPEHDRVLATVLFTDIVGSTETAVALGDRRWNDLLTLHHDLVRRELERFRGREIDTAGDGFLAFLTARRGQSTARAPFGTLCAGLTFRCASACIPAKSSWLRRTCAVLLCISLPAWRSLAAPTMCSAAVRAFTKKVSLNSDSPVSWRIGRTVTPG